MSSLDISDSNPPNQAEEMDGKPSISIGARIMRQLKRNQPRIEKPETDLKKKNLNSKAIEKLYLNKSLGRLKHTQLETIFEHEDETDANENFIVEQSKVFGKRKIKRSMSCGDGFNQTKTLKQKRKKRIQRIFGVHKKIKSISMKKFLEHLQASDSVNLITSQPTANDKAWLVFNFESLSNSIDTVFYFLPNDYSLTTAFL